MFKNILDNTITQNFIKLFAVLFIYKMFENNFTEIKQVFDNNTYGIFLRMLFVLLLLLLLTNNILHSFLLTAFWFGLSSLFNNNSNGDYELDVLPNSYNQSISNETINDDNYIVDNDIKRQLPNKNQQLENIDLDTYYTQPGDEFPQSQTNMLGLVDDFNQKPVDTKDYIDSTNLLEPFCGSENCAI